MAEITNESLEAERSSKAVVLFDVDSTLVRGFSILPFAEFLVTKDLFDPKLLEKMQVDYRDFQEKRLDYREFAVTIVDHYSEGLKDFSVLGVESAAEEYLNTYQAQLLPYAVELIDLMRSQGKTIAISGAPKEVFMPLKRILKLDDAFLLEAELQNGIYTGRTKTNMAIDTEKTQVIRQLKQIGFDISQSFAFGDSEHDLPILEAVSNPFAVSPNEELSRIAIQKGYPIVTIDNIISEVKARLTELRSKA